MVQIVPADIQCMFLYSHSSRLYSHSIILEISDQFIRLKQSGVCYAQGTIKHY